MKTKLNKQTEILKTRSKISKNWSLYKDKKQKILSSKHFSSLKRVEMVKKLRSKTIEKNSSYWDSYRLKVYNSSDTNILKKINEYVIKSGFETHYKVRGKTSNALHKALVKVRKQSDVRYCLVNIELYFSETDQTQVITQTFTKLALDSIDKDVLYSIINQYILKNQKESGISGEYEIKNIFIRMIYENTKTNIKTKKTRKYRKTKT